jgi:phosphoglycolate phosphatase
MGTQVLIRFYMQFQNKYPVFENLIFDLDGTLIDSAPSILGCLKLVVENSGYLGVNKFDSALIGPPLKETLRLITGEINEEKLNILVENFKYEYDLGTCNLAKPYSGIGDLLAALKDAGKRTYIVTNKRYKPTRKILAHLQWDSLISDVYAIDHPNQGQIEKSQVINQLLLNAKLSTDETCYIGDRFEDWDAAKTNKLNFIHVSWGYGLTKDIPSDSILVKTPNQLHQLLIN